MLFFQLHLVVSALGIWNWKIFVTRKNSLIFLLLVVRHKHPSRSSGLTSYNQHIHAKIHLSFARVPCSKPIGEWLLLRIPASNSCCRWLLTSSNIEGGIRLYLCLKGMLSVSSIRCLTAVVWPISVSPPENMSSWSINSCSRTCRRSWG